MKRLALLLLISATCFAAGQAAPKLKFPWAGDKLNEPCGKTELEWRCATSGIDARPVRLNRYSSLVGLKYEPHADGLVVKAAIDIKKSKMPKPTVGSLAGASVLRMAQKDIGRHEKGVLDSFKHLRIEVYAHGKKLQVLDDSNSTIHNR